MLAANACSGGDNQAAPTRASDDHHATTTTVDVAGTERPAVIEARQAAELAATQAVGPPAADPGLSAIAQTHTGPAAEVIAARAGLYQRNTFVLRHPSDTVQRLDVLSVTFADNDPEGGVAWLETCEVDDADVTVQDDGPNAATMVHDYEPRTMLRIEVMQRDDGTWRLADSIVQDYQDGIAGCATTPDTSRPTNEVDPDQDRRDVIAAREQAEADWLASIIDPALPVPTDTHTGWMLDWYAPDSLDHPPATDTCPITAQRPRIDINPNSTDATGTDDPCVRAWVIGTSATTYQFRTPTYGFAFTPNSTATATVQTVTLEDGETPDLAYLQTCRTHNLHRADGHPYAFGQATIHATEAMRWDNGTWKLSARWGYTIEPAEAGCPEADNS
jgi:hypothetical protein